MQHFYSFVSQVCYCWCPPFSAGHAAFLFVCLPCLSLLVSASHVAFLFICLPGLSMVVSALFRWPCSISIHLSPRSVTARQGGPTLLASKVSKAPQKGLQVEETDLKGTFRRLRWRQNFSRCQVTSFKLRSTTSFRVPAFCTKPGSMTGSAQRFGVPKEEELGQCG